MRAPYLRNSDIVLGAFVIAIAAMLLIPLPTILLDFLLVLNISFSLLLLLVGLYMPNALALLAFPSLLLLTTLFRLGLNVASTRLILSQAHAGDVIQAFGTFLIRGEIVVGIIIFTIITIVNFIVIARGSSRVSEVAARFALDALPGKQMAIDSDLRAGLLTPGEAEAKREDLRKESQLFGSMDGAMKFVQGDAIAGFFIIFANIIGGLYLGLSNGLAFGEAVQTYSTLTVGDGLVSQIPALLISICAGIVVTRVSAEKDSTLGIDVSRQLFRRPTNLFLAGFLLVVLGLLPGLPFLPFLMVALCFFVGAWFAGRTFSSTQQEVTRAGAKVTQIALPAYQSQDDPKLELPTTGIRFHFDSAVLYPQFEKNREKMQGKWRELQSAVWDKVGISLPRFFASSDKSLSVGGFSCFHRETFCFAGDLPLDALFVEMNPTHADILGLTVIKKELHPVSNALVFWTKDNRFTRTLLSQAEISYYHSFEYIGLLLAKFVRQHPEEFITMSDIHSRLKELEATHPGLLSDSLPTDFFTTARITQVFHQCIREGGSVKNVTDALEGLAGYVSSYGASLVRENEFDLFDIVSYLRLHQKRMTQNSYATKGNAIRVCRLSNEVQEVFEMTTVDSASGSPMLDRELQDRLAEGLASALENAQKRGLMPLVILASREIRSILVKFLEGLAHSYVVLSPAEIGPSLEVEPVTEWRI